MLVGSLPLMPRAGLTPREGSRPRRRTLRPADFAALSAAIVILGPALAPGYVLLRDMIFVPTPPLTPRLLGLTAETPRAVPSDLFVALVSQVLPGWLVQSAVLLAVLVAAGSGAARLVPGRSSVSQSAAAIAALWNPWVAERLAMGQWTVLAGYAAVPWVVRLLLRRVQQRSAWLGLAGVLCAVGVVGASAQVLVSITMMGVLVTVWLRGGRSPVRPAAPVLVLHAALHLPWMIPALFASDQQLIDPAVGFEAFAPRADLPLGIAASVLTGGGIWNAAAVPPGRDTWPSTMGAVLLLAGAGAGWWMSQRGATRPGPRPVVDDSDLVVPTVVAGLLGLSVLVLASWHPTGSLVQDLPGGGLLRDSTRQSGPWVVAIAAGIGVLTDRLHAMRQRVAAWGLAVLPVVLLPAMAWGLLGQLRSTHLPASVTGAADYLRARDDGRAVVVLPYVANRAYPWNGYRPSQTPWTRLLPQPTLVSSDLILAVGTQTVTVPGEDARSVLVEQALLDPEPARALSGVGVGWVLIDTADVTPPAGSVEVFTTRDVRILSIPPQARAGPDVRAVGRRPFAPVLVGDLATLVAVAAGLRLARRGTGRRPRSA